jgi:hypothetical protein
MQTKLTLRLDATLIERAKNYSRLRHKSISQMVADYFSLLNGDAPLGGKTLPPLTRSLLGVAAREGSNTGLEPEDYRVHLLEKHLTGIIHEK